ncbi:peroxisomal membrane protein PEX16 [Nannizzia gypsea CBS 118893]|uniref:Peroxisomal membrane protein PEX16 n=1 Tax=Arthroderma gypseum (strain ATCC MYA-4604 / CBS 118893) TaxID=535722 RepID=E4UZ21_ARTGP|nr:peroxisomal membrane protein PEX16 [Nannizzia gypsea CBS 118893]EFR03351.1 peroxisomal membrane protein PEX16 [Nannizzia gypsea CBS 118893]
MSFRDQIPEVLQPAKLVEMYEEFVTKNASSVGQVESALRSLTYIIPGRFREAELASESIHSGVQLLSLYHDSLVSRVIARLPLSQPRPTPSPHTRYTKYWTFQSPLYHKVALALQMVKYTELLWEMAARRKGEKLRWRVVVFIEAVKALCRLILLRLTNSRPIVSPPLPEREVDPRQVEENDSGDFNGMETPPSEPSEAIDLIWTMPRTGMALPNLPDANDISAYLTSKVLTADDVRSPQTLLHRISGIGQLAEILYILRPLIYVIALQRYRAKKKSWTPWLIGFGLEFTCRQLAKKEFRDRVAGGLRGLSKLEREELSKRGWGMGWWLMRGAFYENVTKSWIKSITNSLRDKPLLGLVGSVIEDYEYLWDNYYFSTATM